MIERHGIQYKELSGRKYKYHLQRSYAVDVGIYPTTAYEIPGFLVLTPDGKLLIQQGYQWDGPSGPSVDTDDFMRGSLIHDALYQLIRETGLVYGWKNQADEELWEACIEDGMPRWRAYYVWLAVKWFGKHSL